MTRLLFVPNSYTLQWFDVEGEPRTIVEDVLRGDWQPPAPYAATSSHLNAFWQEDGLVIVCGMELKSATAPPSLPPFSRRQREVLKGLIEGLSSRQIAYRLGVEERMVYYHIANLKTLLSATSRAELVHKARDLKK